MTFLARRPKPQRYEPPKVGDYVAHRHGAHGPFQYGGSVDLKIGNLADTRISACATFEGATKLAKLLNDVRDLAETWRDLSTEPLHKGGSAEEWAKIKIASSVCRALGINAMHDFGASAMGLPVIGKAPDEAEQGEAA